MMIWNSTPSKPTGKARTTPMFKWLAKKISKLVSRPCTKKNNLKSKPSVPSFAPCGVKMSGCFSWRSSRRAHCAVELFDDEEIIKKEVDVDQEARMITIKAFVPTTTTAAAAPTTAVANDDEIFNMSLTVSLPDDEDIVEEALAITPADAPLVAITPKAVSPAAVSPKAPTSEEIVQISLTISLPDNEDVVEENVLPSAPAADTLSEPSPNDPSPVAGAKKEISSSFVMPTFPEKGIIWTPTQVESFIKKQVADCTAFVNAPLRWEADFVVAPRLPPPPALPCIIPVGLGILFPERPVDPLAGKKILEALLCFSKFFSNAAAGAALAAPAHAAAASAGASAGASAAAPAAPASAGAAPASLRVEAKAFVMPKVSTEPVDQAGKDFKAMLYNAQLKSVGGDAALLAAKIANRRDADREAASKSSQPSFDPKKAMAYFENRHRELLDA